MKCWVRGHVGGFGKGSGWSGDGGGGRGWVGVGEGEGGGKWPCLSVCTVSRAEAASQGQGCLVAAYSNAACEFVEKIVISVK